MTTGHVLEESADSLIQASKVLDDGGIVVVPSRTNYALICDCENERAVERVFEAKRRTKFGPLTLAVATIDSTADYVKLPAEFGLDELKKVWPSETSFIFRLEHRFPPRMTMGAGTVAVMYQRESALMRLLSVHRKPVALTSANLSGQGNIVVTRERAIADVGGEVDLVVVNDRQDEQIDVVAEGVNPSNTIVDFTFDVPYLVRDGAYPYKKLLPLIPDLVCDVDQYKQALQRRLTAQDDAAR